MKKGFRFKRNFWERVEVKESGCWEWVGGKDAHGYGAYWLEGKMRKAHQLAWEHSNGPLPSGKGVLHHCDNPPCCRPDHLFIGTQADNVADCLAKGRNYRRAA